MNGRVITLRGVEVHNLRRVDLDLPHRKLIVFCGLSGSGKSSLAFDTLYAEGQRRYIESFSAYTRQFLERLEKPAAERIDGIPPAIAIAGKSPNRSSRSTVATTTEIHDYLRLLFAKIGQVICYRCGRPVRRESPHDVADALTQLPPGTRYLVAFARRGADQLASDQLTAALVEEGFLRVVTQGRMVSLDAQPLTSPVIEPVDVVVDRLSATGAVDRRMRDSIETAYRHGDGACTIFFEPGGNSPLEAISAESAIDGQRWRRIAYSARLHCEHCNLDYPDPEPRLFSFNSPLGACPVCEGFGSVSDIDFDLVVPDPTKSLREGAIAPWNTPAYQHELEELLAIADELRLPVDIPFNELAEEHRRHILEGVPHRKFGGLRGFFAWLERRKYKMHIRVFLSRWRSYRSCEACGGKRLRPEALAVRIAGKNIADLAALEVREAIAWFDAVGLSDHERLVARTMLDQIQWRLRFLEIVGLDYVGLDRALRTLSGGEAQRVTLTSALGSSLV
ncbi:MAG TPA: excinuclease ABC subunit A, partial [Pirellulales bacterium]|nr:excinuclease ABC subunit A [Pirellulales bacterium]